VIITTLALLFLLPLLILIAALIKVDSPGPVLYVHRRLGKKGEMFKCLKFRTMYVNSEELLDSYLERNPHVWEEWSRYKKLREYDPRVTRLGRFLRRLTLDELPQLVNVIKGDMSMVGPRPFLPRELPELGAYGDIILSMQPGMAGMWIAYGRSELSFRQRLKLDAWYVGNWSLRLDVSLFVKSLQQVLTCRGSH